MIFYDALQEPIEIIFWKLVRIFLKGEGLCFCQSCVFSEEVDIKESRL